MNETKKTFTLRIDKDEGEGKCITALNTCMNASRELIFGELHAIIKESNVKQATKKS